MLSALVILFGFLTTFALPKAEAISNDIDPKNICVPRYKEGTDEDHYAVDGWLAARFINRATIEITYRPNGQCVSPSGLGSEYFSASTTFTEALGGSNSLTLTDDTHGAGMDYRVRYSGDDSDDNTRIDRFGDLDAKIKDSFGGHDKIISTPDLQALLDKVELTFGLEEDKVGLGCSGAQNQNFVLDAGKSPPEWRCWDSAYRGRGIGASGGIGDLTGFQIGSSNFSNLDTFNITFNVLTDGQFVKVEPVWENERDNKTFVWCPGVNQFRTSCVDSNDYLILVESLDEVQSINSTKTLTIKDTKSGATEPIVAAGTGSGGGGSVSSPQGANEACYTSWEWSWAACPIITAAQTTANAMYGFVQDQLKFKVPDDVGGQDGEVEKVWNNFRILVSGLVVILMLVMVIGQAIGSGPFDAYTVRKLLPRIVIGVILIQISWPMFAWLINLVNELAIGLADILYAPFGGSDALSLTKILGQFGPGAEIFGWVGIPALAIFSVVAPFIVLGLILTVLVAIFMGFLTLLFRKILIILALIFAPVALIAWMMPSEGLRRYWKLWWDNFIKALMMFPLIVAIIAAGRIFAKIGSGQGGDFVGFFIVLVGFFGPLFILPKTFKWGGTVMQLAGNALTKAQAATLKKPKEYLQKQQEGWNALRDARSSNRYNNPDQYRGWNRLKFWQQPIDYFKAGKLNPLLGVPGSELRARQRAAFVARGDEYDRKQREEAGILREKIENRLNENDARGGNKDDLYQDMLRVARGETALKRYYDTGGEEMDLNKLIGIGKLSGARNRMIMRRAALDRMTELGAGTNWRHVEAEHERIMTSGTAEERTAWRKFLNDNKTIILEKIPDLLKGVGSVSDISAEGISHMHGVGVERMISKTHADATEGARRLADGTMETAEQVVARQVTGQARLTKFLTTYNEALNNSNLRGYLEQNGLRAVKAFVTDEPEYRRQILYDDPAHVHNDEEDGRQIIAANVGPGGRPVRQGSSGMGYIGEPLLDPVIGTYPDGRPIDIAAPTRGARSSQTVLNTVPEELRRSLDHEINVDGSFRPPRRP